MNNKIDEIKVFLEAEIVPRYDAFDAGHRRDHVHSVMRESLRLATFYPQVEPSMVLVAAAYHDLGLAVGREEHHVESAKIVRADSRLLRWFTPQQIEVIAQAAEDHRASSSREPRSLYGRLVAEADRQIVPEEIVRRTMQFTRAHSPELGEEAQYARLVEHLNEKYARGGYLRLWIPESGNTRGLEVLRSLIADEPRLRALFNRLLPTLLQRRLELSS